MKSKALNTKFQSEYWGKNKNARGYDHFIVEFFAKQRIDYLKKKIDLNSVKSAFDDGCGDGFATYYMSKEIRKVDGGDISELMLKNNPVKTRLLVIDAENLPLKDNEYELLYMWEVLHHVPDAQKAVNEMARVASKYVILFEPNRLNPLQALFGLLVKQERGTLRSSKKYLENLVKKAGLEIISSEYCGKIPPNKTPKWLFLIIKRLPFKSTAFTGISIAIIAKKPAKLHA